MFKIGDKVIHSSYGLCEISNIETVENTYWGKQECYIIYMQKTKAMIPIIHAEVLRLPITQEEVAHILAMLDNLEDLPKDRDARNCIDFYTEKFKANNSFKNAEILKDLTYLKETDKLIEKEKKLLDCVKKILVEEISYVKEITILEAEKIINQHLYKPIKKESTKCYRK